MRNAKTGAGEIGMRKSCCGIWVVKREWGAGFLQVTVRGKWRGKGCW